MIFEVINKMKTQNNNKNNQTLQYDKPQEKLFKYGAHQLSDAELLAVILRTGTQGKTVLNLTQELMNKFHTFKNMVNISNVELYQIKGIGKVKIAQIKAILEIAKSYNASDVPLQKIRIKTLNDAVNLLKVRMSDLKVELSKIILLTARSYVIDIIDVSSSGTPTSSTPVIRNIITKAMNNFASAIIFVHNHPSGDPLPSDSDKEFTEELKKICNVMEIQFHDHLIFGLNTYFSFKKNKTCQYQNKIDLTNRRQNEDRRKL